MDVTKYFEEVDSTPPLGSIARIIGQEGSGKSSLALSAPGPISHLSFSENTWPATSRTKKKYPQKKMVISKLGGLLSQVDFVDTLELGDELKDKVKDRAKEALQKFCGIWMWALINYRTVVLDTDKALADLVHHWHFGSVKGEVMPHEYAAPNRVFEDLIKMARDLPCKYPHRNVIFIGKMKEAWGLVGAKQTLGKTGKYNPIGKGEMLYFPEVILQTELDKERAKMNLEAVEEIKTEEDLNYIVNPYSVVVKKAGPGGSEYTERRIPGDDCTWANIMGKISGVDPELWAEELPPIEGWEELDPETWTLEIQRSLKGV